MATPHASFSMDKAHSSIEFSARHMMISRVRGRFENFEGSFFIDEQNPANSTVDVTIDMAGINTRESQRDDHLRSPDFFNVAEFPQARFKSTRVEPSGKNSAKLHGDLTIRNVTKPVVIAVEYLGSSLSPWGKTAYGFEGRTRISRKEWDLTWNVALETGGVLVSDEIDINIELELVKEVEAQPAAAVA